MNDHDTNVAGLKLLIIWLGTMAGNMTLSTAVLGSTLVFTVLQIFMILRRLWKGIP